MLYVIDLNCINKIAELILCEFISQWFLNFNKLKKILYYSINLKLEFIIFFKKYVHYV